MELQPKSQKIHFHIVLFNPAVDRAEKTAKKLWALALWTSEKSDDRKLRPVYGQIPRQKLSGLSRRGKKHYFRSRGLVEAQILRHDASVSDIASSLP